MRILNLDCGLGWYVFSLTNWSVCVIFIALVKSVIGDTYLLLSLLRLRLEILTLDFFCVYIFVGS